MPYSTAPIQKDCLESPYAADSDLSPEFHDDADSNSSPDFHDLDLSPDFRDLNPINHTITSTIIQSSYLHPPVGQDHAIYLSALIYTIISKDLTLIGMSIKSINQLYYL